MPLLLAILPLQLGYAQALAKAHLRQRRTGVNQHYSRLARKRNATVRSKAAPTSASPFPCLLRRILYHI